MDKKKEEKNLVKLVLRAVLRQCWRLDRIGLDHGQLSYAPSHLIINENNVPFIVDFETASMNRKPSNVTSICQFLFLSGTLSENVTDKLGRQDKCAIIEMLRRYKNERSFKCFEKVLAVCGI